MRNVRDLQFIILPTRPAVDFRYVSLYNKIFNYWFVFWRDVLHKNGSPHEVNPADFARADLVSALVNKDEVVAIFLHSVLNLQLTNTLHNPYLTGEKSECFRNLLQESGTQLAFTVEYITVAPAWRKNEIGVSLCKAMLGTSLKMHQELNAELTFIKAREDVKVSRSVLEMGGTAHLTKLDMHNTPVSLMTMSADKIRLDDETKLLTETFWETRKDLTERIPHLKNFRKAA